jgi:hypothetical protein
MSGNSGCTILLLRENSKTFVRKISASIDYNERLKKQAEKQENFVSCNVEIIVPKILRKNFTPKGYYYFDMDYVQGGVLSDYIRKNDINNIKPVVDKVLNFLNRKSLETFDATNIINEKLNSLKCDNKVKDIILNNNWQNTPKLNCHGDFTLENMIVSNEKLYLIDFLDSFLGTNLIDISKLIFDIRYFWSQRNVNKNSKSIVKNIFFEEKLTSLPLYHNHKNKINCLVIMSILRIMPYVEDKDYSLKCFLNRCLKDATKI